jgi:hypothetical protein
MSEPEHHPQDPNHPVRLHADHIHRVALHEVLKVLHKDHPHLTHLHSETVKAHDDVSRLVLQTAAVTGL